MYCRKDVISTGVSVANGVEKSALAMILPDFSTSATSEPSFEMTFRSVFYRAKS